VIFDLSAVGTKGEPSIIDWTARDVILYALGVGAGQADAAAELQFTTQNSDGVALQVLPAFGVVQALNHGRRPRVGKIPLAKVLHGEQSFVLREPLPPEGTVRVQATVTGIYDQGSSAHIVTDTTLTDPETSRELMATTSTLVVTGEGGFGGERRPSTGWERPAGKPDLELSASVRPDQALLYRLSGDWNPLHSDPAFARKAGFARPILHGLCTFGIAGRLLINEICGGDAASVREMGGRFSKPVLPGATLTVRAWVDGGAVRYVVEDDAGAVVLDRGHFTFVSAAGDSPAPAAR
jgi:acyl dehydratase